MKFYNYGSSNNPKILLIHGGFLGTWSLTNLINELKNNYFLIIPELEGHGSSVNTTFQGIESSAEQIIEYLDRHSYNQLEIIGGFSVGAQVTSEILMQRPTISKYAIIESGCERYVPLPKFIIRYAMRYKRGLYYKRFLDKICPLPKLQGELFSRHYDSMSMDSLINTCYSNLQHKADKRLKSCTAKVIIIYGGKEPAVMKRAAMKLKQLIPKNVLVSVNTLKHGGVSLWNPEMYLALINQLPTMVFDS